MEIRYSCTLGEFNSKIARYLYKNLGTPKPKLKDFNHEKFKCLSYSSEEKGVSAEVRIVPDYIVNEKKYTLAIKVQISLKTPLKHRDDSIRKGLERILTKKVQ